MQLVELAPLQLLRRLKCSRCLFQASSPSRPARQPNSRHSRQLRILLQRVHSLPWNHSWSATPAVSARKTSSTAKSRPSTAATPPTAASRAQILVFPLRSTVSLEMPSRYHRRRMPVLAGAITFIAAATIRHGIKPKLARKRMAPQQPLQSEPRSARQPKPLHRFIRILRAARHKSALPGEQHRQVRLIKTQRHQPNARRHSGDVHRRYFVVIVLDVPRLRRHHAIPLFTTRKNSLVTTPNSARTTTFFRWITRSQPAPISSRCSRTISRTRRRMRLRTTAPPISFLMLNPNRL